MSWYAKPTDPDYNKFKEESTNLRQPWKFWLKKGETKKVLFLDDQQFAVREGTIKVPGGFETYTCSGDENSYFIRNGINTTYVQYCTVLDLTPYKAKDGTEKKYSKKCFAASGAALEMLNRRRQEKGGSLTGWVVECSRDGDKSPRVGNDFVLKEKMDLSKFAPEVTKPYDFEKMLRPPKYEAVKARATGAGNYDEDPETVSRTETSEDAPF